MTSLRWSVTEYSFANTKPELNEMLNDVIAAALKTVTLVRVLESCYRKYTLAAPQNFELIQGNAPRNPSI